MTETGLTPSELTRIRRAARTDGTDIKGILTGHSPSVAPEISTDECALIRCMRGYGKKVKGICTELGVGSSTVRTHATGRCGHNADVSVPPTVYEGVGGDRVVDARATRQRRRLWRVEREIKSEADGGERDEGGGAGG